MSRRLLVATCALICLLVAPVRIQAQTPVAAPTIDSVIPGNGRLTVAWTAPAGVTGITAYDLRHIRSDAPDKAGANWTEIEDIWTTGSGDLAYTLDGLDNGVGQDVQMRTVTTTDGAWSVTSTGTPQIPGPAITSVVIGDGALTVIWTAPVVAATTAIGAYDVRYIESTAADKANANWTVAEGFWTSGSLHGVLAGLTNTTGYDVQVRAVAATDGAWSATAVGTPAEHGGTLETATTLPLTTRMGGVIESGTDVDYFTLELTAATGIIVYTRGDLDTVGQLLDVDGELLSENDQGDELHGRHNFLLWGSLQAGTYYVRVTGGDGATGAYVLGVTTVADSTARSDAQEVAVGGFARGIIDPETTDKDWFRITLTGHTILLVHTTGPAHTSGDLWLSGTGRPPNVERFPLGSNHFFVRANLSPGTYYVEVDGYLDATGAYTLHVNRAAEPGSSTEAAEPLVPLFPKAGTIDPADDVDYFRIELARATHVVLGASGSAVAIAGELLDADANTVDANIFESRYTISAPAGFTLRDRLGAGTYYLTVTHLPGSSGPATGRYGLRMWEDYVYGEFFDGCTALTASLSDPLSDPLSGCQWHLDNTGQLGGTPGEDINVREVWAAGHLGEGATVALVDNGFDDGHPDLAPNVIADRNYGYGGVDVFNPGNTHGTGAAGLIAARDNGIGVRGIAPRAQIYVYNLIDAYSHAYAADAMTRGMETTAISNNSWSVTEGPGYAAAPSGWERAVVRGVTEGYGGKGVLYVRSGGNDAVLGANSNLSGFRNHYTATAACAVTDHGVRSHYSEQGANLWVCAPSGASYLPAAITTTDNFGRYRNTYGGTSATGAIVSGVAALLRGAHADLTWRDVKLILAGSARKNDPSNTGWEEGALRYGSATQRYAFNHEYGFGVVDAGEAMDLAAGWTSLPRFIEETQESGDVSLAVPDLPSPGTPTTVTSSITMGSGVQFIEFVSIRPSLTAAAFRDLQIELESPSGRVSVLSPHYLVGSRECTSLFGILPGRCDLDGVVRLGSARHLGEDPAGVWTLRITDHVTGGAAARLNAWSLTVYGHRASPAAPAIDAVEDGSESLAVSWTAPTNTGASAITAYDLRTILTSADETADADWTVVQDAWTTGSGALSYVVTGLTGNAGYDVQVRGVNDSGDGLWSETATGTPTTDEAPTIDTVTPGDQSIAVAWTAPTNASLGTVTSYDLRYISADATNRADTNWAVVTSIWSSGSLDYTLNPTITPLVNGVSYDLQVRAVVGTDQHPWSGVRSATPRTTPGAPAIDAVTGAGGSLTVGWGEPGSDGGDGITSYDLRYITTGADETLAANWTVKLGVRSSGDPDREYDITGLDSGTQYDVQVRAVNGAGAGAWSPTSVGTTRPGAPAIDSVSGVSRGLTVRWSAPAPDGDAAVASYDLRYIETSGDETVEANWTVRSAVWAAGDLAATVTGLEVGTQYDVQMRAVNASGAGPWSATRMGTTALSDDATLSALTLSGVRLAPAFSGGMTSYTASVGYTVTRITVAVTTSDGNAAAVFLDGNGDTRSDADGAAGFQVDLSVGENVIRVEVTAQDSVATGTYSVTVTRTEQDLSLTPPASDPVAPVASTALYTIRFRGHWTTAVTPGRRPGGAHFSRLIGAVHNAGVTFLESGGTASPGVESMAEVGGTSSLRGDVNSARNADPPTALSVLEGSTNSIGPTATRTLSNRTFTTAFPRVTLTTMIAPSHDWFVGVSGLRLLDASGEWLRSLEVDLFPWDAGTEEGEDFSLSPSVATTPRGEITSIRGTGKFTTERMASLTFTLQSISPSFPAAETGTRGVPENAAAGQEIGEPVAAEDPDSGDSLSYALGGPDAASFAIVASTGQLRTRATLDHEAASSYSVAVTATDTSGLSDTIEVAITVTNVEEAGVVSLGPAQPRVGTVLRASLSDPDGDVRSVSWRWQRSPDQTSWTSVSGSGARYTPKSADEGMYIRARATYADGEGTGKSAEAESGQPVGAREAAPGITVVTLVSGLRIPWDLAFAPDGTMLLTERGGALTARLTDGTVQDVTADFSDLFVSGEAGLMAILVDPGFASNRRFYTCQAHTGPVVQVIAWTMNSDYTAATRVADPLVGGIPADSIHDGCRLRFGPQGFLWIATGDAASGAAPQDLTSLGGKVLRVDASTGAGAPGNPFAASARVYTYGHRNPQGLARRPGTDQMWSVEHGPTVDDEINLLTSGGNYGWDPVPDYDQSVPMTDLVKFPDAVEARWSSGDPTLATSGGIFLRGPDWEEWNGRLAVATLKTRSLRIFEFTSAGTFVSQVVVPALDGTYGRLRTPMLGPGGALYLTTSNGGAADRILMVAPSRPPAFAASTDTREVAENNSTSAVVATVTAADPDGERLTYTLGGVDAGVFAIPNPAAGGLRANVRFDHEARRSYEVVVTATDPYGLSDSVTLTVTVTDVDEPADVSFAAAGRVAVNSDNALAVDENHEGTLATFSASDPENKAGLTYEWSVGGTDGGDFALTAGGVLSFASVPDHERPADSGGNNVYDITVSALDSDGKTGSTALTITVDPVNEPPAITGDAAPRIGEGGTLLVGTYRATDPEAATIAWQPLAGSDSDEFDFNSSNGRLAFKAAPDYEDATDSGGNNVYDVTLSVSAGGHATTLDVAVSVTNRDETGALGFSSPQPQADADYTATLSDPDGVSSTTWTWERSRSRSGLWTALTGAIDRLTTSVHRPVAADVGYYLRATAAYSDGHGPNKSRLLVSVNPVQAAPVANATPSFDEPTPTRSVPENAGARAAVGGPVTATDTDSADVLAYELSGSDLFTVDSDSGQIRVVAGDSLDHETAPSHDVTIRASDSSNAFGTVTVTIDVTDVNEPPDAVGDTATVSEDGDVTIDVLANDSDPEQERRELLLTVVTPPLNGRASVNEPASAGDRRTITYEPNADYHGADTFTYRARDTGSPSLSNIATVSVQVDAVNDTPTFASQATTRSVSESAEAGDHVGAPVTATDIDENDTLTYSLSGPDALSFVIDAAGQVAVGTGVTFDAATAPEYAVTVEARDRAGASASIDVTITVTAGPVVSGGPGGGGGGGGGGPSPSTLDFEWTVEHDIEALDPTHDSPTGAWSDGATLWVLQNGSGSDDALYAYDLETGERAPEREFELDGRNRAPRGVWSDRTITILWVSDSGQNTLFAHDLETGERLPGRDVALAPRNRDARGIGSDGETMWVLDGGKNALFAYDLETGEPLAEYALDPANDDPRGLWSDGVTVWISDHIAKRLFAYRLPVLPDDEGDSGEDDAEDDPRELERVIDEEFGKLSGASNNSPRGLWSDGDVMYVADQSDDRVYSYNMPDAIDARLASLTLSGVDIGEFSPRGREYQGVVGEGVTETTVAAEAMQRRATVALDPPDADGDDTNGDQVALEGVAEITVTVTSADGSRTRVYRVALGDPEQEATPGPWPHCLRGDVAEGFSLVLYEGGSVEELEDCVRGRHVSALYATHDGAFVSHILGAPAFVNRDFRELHAGGVPPATLLLARSDGPATAEPGGGGPPGGGAPEPWPECLRGDLAAGFSLVLYEGGGVEDLAACARGRGASALYALDDGAFVSYILGAPEFVNRDFGELFAGGLPAATPLLARSEGPAATN